MRLKILGSAAGGGFPQWNCNYRLSRAVRNGEGGFRRRTQSSLGVSADGENWIVFNASPDIGEQIAAAPELQPMEEGPLRASPIQAVVLTNADVDHIAGLLSLRERHRFVIYATARVLRVIEENSIFNVLDRQLVERRELLLDVPTPVADWQGKPTSVVIEAFSVPGKIALFLEDAGRAQEGFGTQEGDTVGVRIVQEGGHSSALYIPGCAAIDADLRRRVAASSCLLFDGTVYTDDEMLSAGVGAKTGRRMGHLHIAGSDGSMAMLAAVAPTRRIYVHINNTNPILDESSPEAAAVRAAGWEIGYDGMEIGI
ncbi:pyrroloquinoline quinone biosynthesis protein PqqB (plasmid) [Rhizobium etli 8C-3]|uniref:Coenzyme PQQ synthesis protein B n=2 Tax=Rhizobium TaxID=379 RepID=A0A4R3RVB6_9HYPH|nr:MULTISPECIES: pyrroloquinoline quinone biosynthesis protein PqqB [Rhizobium]APO78403.1 pyrroloquinoline quinone biosynthesis protein PqqB [Rhizobium etli 8C-3]TCU24805.1 pyrroloquinoline quinone biosynthesis protein B [Rhizobium azibense]TCU39551.1 pyrroloquinoline quinone biosynthesis protein B [Rhizobium azibense]